MSALTYSLYIVIGLIHQAVAYLMPFRHQAPNAQWRLDIVAVLMTSLFAGLYVFLIETPMLDRVFASEWNAWWYEYVVQWPVWVLVALSIISADFLLYWAHRLLHTALLWHTHAWHHAAKHLWWMAGLRGSPLHVIINFLPSAFVYVFFPTPDAGLIALAMACLTIVNQHYQHSNIRFPYADKLELLFVTPRYHFVHHSANPKYTNSNYGFIFSVWDRLFGTYTNPNDIEPNETLGLDYSNTSLRLLFGLPPAAQERGKSS